MIKRKRLWVPMIFESFVEAKLILSINFFPRGGKTHNKPIIKQSLLGASEKHHAKNMVSCGKQFGSSSEAVRKQLGSSSEAARKQLGSSSEAVRKQFGSNSEAARKQLGSSSEAIRKQGRLAR